jgi:hypothetical protein
MSMPGKTPGQIRFEAYCSESGRAADWAELDQETRDAWEKRARGANAPDADWNQGTEYRSAGWRS